MPDGPQGVKSNPSRSQFLPIVVWARRYNGQKLAADGVAALIVAGVLIPQAMAYALLAGMPAQTGLYASLGGLTLYCVFGTSNTLSVAPVAVVSLMTASALASLNLATTADYVAAAISLAFLCGLFSAGMGVLRLGFVANFVAQPVISAFITGSAILIAIGQLGHLLGTAVDGQTPLQQLPSLLMALPRVNLPTLWLGVVSVVGILWCRTGLRAWLQTCGVPGAIAATVSRTGPLLVIVLAALLTFGFGLDRYGIALLGNIPAGLPAFHVPRIQAEQLRALAGSAVLISVIGFVESVSIARIMAAKCRERIDLDQELVALGTANIAAAAAGAFPVSGGFSRSMVNWEAGAATPAAGLFAALLVALVGWLLAPLLFWIPQVCLAATIVVAVYSLLDFSVLVKSWRYTKADFVAVASTLVLTLAVGVETGLASGVLVSLLIHLYQGSRPHVAVVGRVPGTEHFRNVNRHRVETCPNLLSIRVDESLYFANSRYLEELILGLIADQPGVEHVILMCTAVNRIDLGALETLERINQILQESGVRLHLSEVKGPVMDRLADTDFFLHLSGNSYLSHHQAVKALQHPVPVDPA